MNQLSKNPKSHYLALIQQSLSNKQQIQSIVKVIENYKTPKQLISIIIKIFNEKHRKYLILHTYFFLKSLKTSILDLQVLLSYFPVAFQGQQLVSILKDAAYYAGSQNQIQFGFCLLDNVFNLQRNYLLQQEFQPKKIIGKFLQTLREFNKISAQNKQKQFKNLKIDESDFQPAQQPISRVLTQEQLILDLYLCEISYNVYYSKNLNDRVFMKNFTPKPYKPRFQGFITDKSLYIAISGTWNIADTVSDADIEPVLVFIGGKQIYAHQGFYKVAEFIHRSIMITIPFLIQHNYIENIIFTGHSQGAAAAIILQALFQQSYPSFPSQAVGFGTPPFLSRNFEIENCRSYINNNDCIPRAGLVYGYIEQIRKTCNQHSTEEISEYFERKFSQRTDFYVPGDIYWLNSTEITQITRHGVFVHIDSFLDFKAHRLENYTENIKKHIK